MTGKRAPNYSFCLFVLRPGANPGLEVLHLRAPRADLIVRREGRPGQGVPAATEKTYGNPGTQYDF